MNAAPHPTRLSLCIFLLLALGARSPAAEPDAVRSAREYRKGNQPVTAQPDGNLVCEAEEFQVAGTGGWQAKPWGTNYYVATFANSFLSRKAYLGAPEQCDRSEATLRAQVPK